MFTLRFHTVHDFDSLVDLAQACNCALLTPDGSKIVLDLSDVEFAQPNFAAAIACLARRMEMRGKQIDCIPPSNRGCDQYLTDIGLLNGILPGTDGRLKRTDTEAIDLSQFANASPDIVTEVAKKFVPHLEGIADVVGRLEQTFAELMDNVFAHSESPVGGFLCGQFYPAKKVLSFAVCDFGISIPAHLGRLPAYRGSNDETLIKNAFEEGVTGSSTGRYGSGLPFVKELTQILGGWVKVYSRCGSYTLTESFERTDPVRVPFPGTLLHIDWKTA